jgi:hypothetical protein
MFFQSSLGNYLFLLSCLTLFHDALFASHDLSPALFGNIAAQRAQNVKTSLIHLCILWLLVAYLFQGGSVRRAAFSFLRPRAQSACISVCMSRVPS